MLLPVKEQDVGSNPTETANFRKETILMNETKTEKYTRRDRTKRINQQYKKLVAKINYNGRLVAMGSKFGRNAPCPCKSGKKFKKCCIRHHYSNQRKQMSLQKALDKILDKVSRYGLMVGQINKRGQIGAKV